MGRPFGFPTADKGFYKDTSNTKLARWPELNNKDHTVPAV